MKVPFQFFLNLVLINAYDRGPHKLDIVVERFKFESYYFVFYSKGANWAEAFTICQATSSRLAVVNTPERAKFLAAALSQTKVGFEDVWIGGHFIKDSWQWVSTGKSLPSVNNHYPPWLHFPTHRGKNCLSLDRRNHWEPLFVELKCHLYRPFICEESNTGAIDKFPEQANEIIINKHHYFLYHGRVTWHEALTFCKQAETRLATIPDLNTATQLAELMKRARPPFENVWIGAKKDYLGWTWVATDKLIPNETQRNGFPPWRFDHPVDDMKTCVILDHHPCLNPYHVHTVRQHRCEEAVFIEEQCVLKKDFLCETVIDETDTENRTDLITVDQITYIFKRERLSWIDAMISCETINMTLAMPATDRQWETITIHMGDMQNEFDHIWLGGRWIPNEWIWLNNHSIPLPSENSTYPPWCTSPDMLLHEDEEDCLNMDRDAHNVPLIYGFNCSVKQSYICQLDAQESIDSPISTDEYELYPTGLNHFEAEWACKRNHSHLAVVNNIKLAQKVALLLPRETSTWVGARRVNSIWKWITTREVIPDTAGADSYPPWESSEVTGGAVCLAMKSGYREQPLFVEKPCKEKLPYICQWDRKELPQPDVLLELNEKKYYFYKKGVPWSEAMSICNSGDLYLVNVGNLELAHFLLEGMGDTNPQWTAGRQLMQGSWSWATSGAKLPSNIENGYPPWANETVAYEMNKGCLMLNELNELPVFAGEDCMQNHSFVCVNKMHTNNETEMNMNNLTITLHDAITSIANAKNMCLKNGKHLVDFSKLNYTSVAHLFEVEKVKSLWVDVIHDPTGKWVYADTMEEFQTEINFPERDTHPVNDPKNCLTLQMTTNKTLFLQPSLCSDFSRIICVIDEVKTPVIPKVVKQLNETVTLTAILENSDISNSALVCNDIGGEIIKQKLLNDAIEFFKTLPPEYKHFWIGASFETNTWKWSDDTPIQMDGLPDASETKFSNETVELMERKCLIYNRELDKLEAANCFDKSYSTVCEQVQINCPPKAAGNNSVEWIPAKCSLQPISTGTVCRAKCPPNMNLFGPELNICYKGNWSYNLKIDCQVGRSHGKTMDHLTQRYILREVSNSYFLFVLDIGINKNDFRILLQFTRNLGNTILLGSRRQVTIELYSFNSKIIDLMESSNCYFMHTIDRLRETPQLSNSQANYMGAFLTAEGEFADKDVQPGNAFIFFFAMRKDVGSMNRTAVIDRLKERGITVIVISVGDEINRSQLEEIASMKYDGLQLYTFTTMKGLQDASYFLKAKSKVHSQDCPREIGINFG